MSTTRSSSRESYPLLIVLSGPSGVGKDAVVDRMREQGTQYHFTITATTRPRRPNERDGVDYLFVTPRIFKEMKERGELLEWAEVHGNLYGVPRAQIADALKEGRDVLVEVDIQGAATIRRITSGGVFIFLAPPDMDELRRRLCLRMSESLETIELRLRTATVEMAEASKFDYVVVNRTGLLDDAVVEIEAIVDAEKRRAPGRKVLLKQVD